jgi:DMSO/TMAO reductase YedYZ heme-binding membrane subunit
MIGVLLLLASLLLINVLGHAYNVVLFALFLSLLLFSHKNIFKHASIYYVFAFLVGILSLVFNDKPFFDLVTSGVIGYGFFLVVMMMGALPNKWTLSRNIKKNRGVLSILGFISITPHVVLHLFHPAYGLDLFGIASYVIMVPLTMISFKTIKREINPKDWLTIQKAAYVIYGLLFAHLLFVSTWENKIVYAVLLTLYVNNKIVKEWKS